MSIGSIAEKVIGGAVKSFKNNDIPGMVKDSVKAFGREFKEGATSWRK